MYGTDNHHQIEIRLLQIPRFEPLPDQVVQCPSRRLRYPLLC